MNPTFRNLTDSFEGWAYRRGVLRDIQRLERRNFLERNPDSGAERIYRLTEQGRLQALGGRDPSRQWSRPWDGQWRLVAFDLPEKMSSARVRLRRFLRSKHFGYLQNSVWISPDPLPAVITERSTVGNNAESLACFDARPGLGLIDSAIVNGAWNFKQINELYGKCLQVLESYPFSKTIQQSEPRLLQQWFRQERSTWEKAVSADPLLPTDLLPEGYLGKTVWQTRLTVLPQVRKRFG